MAALPMFQMIVRSCFAEHFALDPWTKLAAWPNSRTFTPAATPWHRKNAVQLGSQNLIFHHSYNMITTWLQHGYNYPKTMALGYNYPKTSYNIL